VPAAADRVFCRGCKPERYIVNRVLSGHLRGAGDLKRTVAIMQKGRIGGAQSMCDRGRTLVPAGSDSIEALTPGLKQARDTVELPTGDLRPKQITQACPVQPRLFGRRPRHRREITVFDASQEVFVNDLGAIHVSLPDG